MAHPSEIILPEPAPSRPRYILPNGSELALPMLSPHGQQPQPTGDGQTCVPPDEKSHEEDEESHEQDEQDEVREFAEMLTTQLEAELGEDANFDLNANSDSDEQDEQDEVREFAEILTTQLEAELGEDANFDLNTNSVSETAVPSVPATTSQPESTRDDSPCPPEDTQMSFGFGFGEDLDAGAQYFDFAGFFDGQNQHAVPWPVVNLEMNDDGSIKNDFIPGRVSLLPPSHLSNLPVTLEEQRAMICAIRTPVSNNNLQDIAFICTAQTQASTTGGDDPNVILARARGHVEMALDHMHQARQLALSAVRVAPNANIRWYWQSWDAWVTQQLPKWRDQSLACSFSADDISLALYLQIDAMVKEIAAREQQEIEADH